MIEIKPISKLDSEITVPGSKYIANRVLLLAALANGISRIKNVPENDDINATIRALKNFGIKINKKNDVLEKQSFSGRRKKKKFFSEKMVYWGNGKKKKTKKK